MNALGAAILFIILAVVVSAPKRWAVLGIMAGVLYLTMGQELEIFGFNLYATRFIELAGFARVIGRREFIFSNLNRIDKTLIVLFAYRTIVYLLRSGEEPKFQIGAAVDAYLCYFTFRGLLGGMEDFKWFLRAFAILLAPYTALVLLESFTNQNPFSALGGITLSGEAWYRNGRLRCQGSFLHPSLLGTLGASFIPLYIGLWFTSSKRLYTILGISFCLAIVWATNSGGPANCAAAGIAGWLLWKIRTKLQWVRRGLLMGFVILALLMNAPVWFVLARVSSLSGGDGFHRSELLNQGFIHLGDWWLAGMNIQDTSAWFPYTVEATGGADMTNQFLYYGIVAGLGSMVLFFALLVRAFKNLGAALIAVRTRAPTAAAEEFIIWGLGVMLAAHLVNWLGITYFDQFAVVWYMQLAAISNLCLEVSKTAENKSKEILHGST